MRVYYSQRAESLNPLPDLADMFLRIFRETFPYFLVLLIYPLFRWEASLDRKVLAILLTMIPVSFLLVRLRTAARGRTLLISDGKSRLCLLPDLGKSARTLEDAQEIERDLLHVGVIPPEAMEIQQTLSLWQMSRFCLVRCVLQGSSRTRYFLLDDDFKNYQSLIWEFEERLE